MTQPLNWPQLVAEAIRRRKAEGLTQQAHADLAGVSKPVIIAFDKGETSLSLGRALALLRVVGLVDDAAPPGSHDAFVAAARARWQHLIAGLPANDPARHPWGGYEVNYEIGGITRPRSELSLLEMLEDIDPGLDPQVMGLTGLPFSHPPFATPMPGLTEDGPIEYWASNHSIPYPMPGLSDFWRISSAGYAFMVQGLEMDSPFLLVPTGEYFSAARPIHRAAAVMRHAMCLSEILQATNPQLLFSARYWGLARRKLAAHEMSLSTVSQSLSDTVSLSIRASDNDIRSDLPALVHRFLSPLYALFDGFQLERSFVEQEVARLTRPRRAGGG